MASGFFALFDDIAVLMDDVATMGKIATKKTAGILADDLAVNAEKSSGFVSSREIPVLWKITKGSFLNKLIILPITLLLSAYFPAAIVPILLIGGVYLAYEGVEKIYEFLFHKSHAAPKAALSEMTEEERREYENKKVKSAILVDFILSIEIIIIALGSVIDQPLNIHIAVVSLVAILATIGVYGLVALLVRMDDLGYTLLAMSDNKAAFSKWLGTALVKLLPILIRALSVIGTFAMILVAGGIFVHNVEYIHHSMPNGIPSILFELAIGLLAGAISILLLSMVKKMIPAR